MMLPPAKLWQVADPVPEDISANLTVFPPVFRQILYNREVTDLETAQEYLAALPPRWIDERKMVGISEAADRICRAIENKEKVVIYGDYDADGVTATALLSLLLESLGGQVVSYIPNRFDEGYGLNIEAIRSLRDSGAQVIVTVDCGIRSLEEANLAKTSGIDLIITDHHHPGEELPPAFAVINPRQPLDTYPEKGLAGVGLAYKLGTEILKSSRLSTQGSSPGQEFLDLVAIGTVADLAPLVGENRSLVKSGIKEIQKGQRQGVLSLVKISGLSKERVGSHEIGFMLAPRLNAAGRLESALDALTLLSTTDVNVAGQIAQKLNNQNRERQDITQRMQEQALQQATTLDPDAMILIAIDPGFNPGVVGLAASRLTDKYYRPAIVGHRDDKVTRASCRSIPEFHITNALDQCADLLVRHGGHAAAAGFTVRNEDAAELFDRLKAIAWKELSGLELRPVIKTDVEIELKDLIPELFQLQELIQPTGTGNPPVNFTSYNVKVVRAWAVGHDSSHLRLKVTDGIITYDAIAFRMGQLANSLPPRIDIIYSFETNEYNGKVSFQLNIKDLRPATG